MESTYRGLSDSVFLTLKARDKVRYDRTHVDTVVTSFRFRPEIYALLERASKAMSVSKIAFITFAIRETAKREGIE